MMNRPSLVNDAVDDIRDGHPLYGVEVDMTPNVGNGLKDHAAHRRMFQPKFQDRADFIGVHTMLDGGHQHRVYALLGQTVQGL
jgi:hypothetical protein